MGIGTSIFLIAVGAILKFAVTASVSGVDLDVVGVILMIAGRDRTAGLPVLDDHLGGQAPWSRGRSGRA